MKKSTRKQKIKDEDHLCYHITVACQTFQKLLISIGLLDTNQ